MIKYKILCIIGQLGNGGTEKQLYLFLKYLDRERFIPCIFVAGEEGGVWAQKIQDEIDVDITFAGKISSIKKIFFYRKLIKSLKPDSIFSWSFFTNAFCLFSMGYPFVGSLRQEYSWEKIHLNFARRKLCLFPKKIIVNSSFVADELISSGVPSEKIETVFNIFPIDNYLEKQEKKIQIRQDLRLKYNIPEDAIVIAGAGRDSPTKNFPFFVKVIQALKEREPDKKICVVIFGSGGVAVQNEIEQCGLSDCFVLTGNVNRAARLFPVADIFFLSSLQEGMPNVLLEAIYAGCVPIATDVGGVRDIFSELPEESSQQIVIDKKDISAASEKLQYLISHPELRKTISQTLSEGMHRYVPSEIIKQFEKILQ